MGEEQTRLDVPMRITPLLPSRDDPRVLLPGHERPLLLALVLVVRAGRAPLPALSPRDVGIRPVRPHRHPLLPSGPVAGVDMHVAQPPAHAEEQLHQPPLGKAGVVDEVGVDHVLQVAALVVGEQHVDDLGGRVASHAAAALCGDGVVDAVDDVRRVGEQLVRLDLLHGLRDGLGAEGATDLLEGEQFRGRGVLDEVDVGEAALETERLVSSKHRERRRDKRARDEPRLASVGS